MKKIASFTIDHIKLLRGIYLSRVDEVGGDYVSTFDIRMKEPNREPVIDIPALHAMEHLAATFLRNDPEWADKTVYFGPMGCRTGNYVLFKGKLEPEDIVEIMKKLFGFIALYEGEIPGASAKDCGNYLSMDLPMAKYEAEKFLREVLENIKPENLNYPE
ncbi:S-ribosylhomocysteine lyase [Spirochaeta isovalerica]|uniref:S-ribosylhomocysteine lyase n=1 Tax=Spirochaeta isovalerica TaxID=150 RepID=A0A841R3D1_9SPIO|nr:S-ribosylhomocysteine lyase [Spirochaeta isovalerica]MBB6478385.1 S-ribosylhomocysteine lyase [Spirochaeta isovalerica]